MTADDHPLDDQVRVALHEIAVDKGAGVALIGVADHVLGRVLGSAQKVPLPPGGKARAAAAPQAGLRHLGDHLLVRHAQGLGQPLVAAPGNVVVDLLRIDDPAVGHEPPHLQAEELQRVQRRHAVQRFFREDPQREFGDDAVGRHGLLDQLWHLVRRDPAVEDRGLARARHLHDGLRVAQTPAAGDHHVRLQTAAGQFAADGIQRLLGAGRAGAGGEAHLDDRTLRLRNAAPGLFGLGSDLLVGGHVNG